MMQKPIMTVKQVLGAALLFMSISNTHAMPPFTGDNYSGEYLCKGSNHQVGDYEVLVTLKLNEVTSHDMYGVYDFSTESNHQATYTGQIMATKNKFAMTFKLVDATKGQYSTGMGEFKKVGTNLWAFSTTYYEPDGKGGNFGRDQCKMQLSNVSQSKPSEEPVKLKKQPS